MILLKISRNFHELLKKFPVNNIKKNFFRVGAVGTIIRIILQIVSLRPLDKILDPPLLKLNMREISGTLWKQYRVLFLSLGCATEHISSSFFRDLFLKLLIDSDDLLKAL